MRNRLNPNEKSARRRAGVIVAAVTGVSLLTGACSTAPRDFTPTLTTSGAASDVANADLRACKAQVAEQIDPKSGKAKAVVAGSAVGVGAGAVTAASATSGAGMLSGAAAGAGLVTGFALAAPVAIVVISKTIRSRKERAIQAAMTQCLQERGYVVSDWRRTPR